MTAALSSPVDALMPAAPLLNVRVYGTPAPQGSKRHVGNGIMVESSKRVKPWREAVKTAAIDARWLALDSDATHPPTADGPLDATLTFLLDRPRSHYRTGKNAHLLRDSAPLWPTYKPDIDKLVRSTLDALKDAGVYRDDSQIVNLAVSKVYADSGRGIPGADITIRSTP